MGAWRWLRVGLARAAWLQGRPQQVRGLQCAGAGPTPTEAVLFAPGLTALAQFAQAQFAREAAALSHQTARLLSDQARIVQGRIDQFQIVQGAVALPQAQRGWWNRLLAMCLPNLCQRLHPQVCGMQNLSGLRLAPGLQGQEPLF